MEIARALEISERVLGELAPHCDRIAIAGSVRRRKPQVKDIEIVCIPRKAPVDLFGDEMQTDAAFCELVNQWPAVRGKPTGKYTQRTLPDGIALDLFMATPENWGVIYAIRTGSAEFSHRVLAGRWCRLGYTSVAGILRDRRGHRVEAREERDLFKLLGIAWVEPECREIRGTL